MTTVSKWQLYGLRGLLMPSSVLIHQLPQPFPFCQGPEATAPAVPLPPVPASGLVANAGSLRCQERKQGTVCALTFISDGVGRKAEEKLGVGRKLQGLVRKKLSLRSCSRDR